MHLSPEKRNFVQLVPYSPIVLLFTSSTLFPPNIFTVAFLSCFGLCGILLARQTLFPVMVWLHYFVSSAC